MSKKVERKDLIMAAEELNTIMELNPAIPVTKKVTDEELIEKLIEASELIAPADEVSVKTKSIIESIGGTLPEEKPAKSSKKNPEPDPDDNDDDDEPVTKKPSKPAPKKAPEKEDEPVVKKPAAKKPIVDDDDDDDAPVTKKPAAKAPVAKKTAGYSRTKAVAEVLKAKPTMKMEDVLEKADALFVKNGGNSNPKETRAIYNFVIQVFQVLELV